MSIERITTEQLMAALEQKKSKPIITDELIDQLGNKGEDLTDSEVNILVDWVLSEKADYERIKKETSKVENED